MPNLIEFKHFSAYYKQKKNYLVAVDDVTFCVEEGECLVLLGPSGCGKTTVLKGVLGRCEHTSGEVYLDGGAVSSALKTDGQISYVSQEYSLYPTMTVYENIAFPLRMMHTPQEETDRRVRELAKLLELDWLLTRKPKQLSGGQQQRVALARALIKEPRLLLLDEPFANLHRDLRLQTRELVKRIQTEQRVTILFVTHDLEEAAGIADRIIVMKDGEMLRTVMPKELEQGNWIDDLKELFNR